MREIDFNIKESPFYNFFSPRLSISSRMDVKETWNFSKENELSFFIVSLACLLSGLNSVPELRRRIINDKVIEFDNIDAITPIMDKDEKTYLEMKAPSIKKEDTIFAWHEKILKLKKDILNNYENPYSISMDKRDNEPIANFSCIKWVDFETLTSAIAEPHQVQPLVSWGKVSNDKKMSVALTANHIFVHGKEMGDFFNNSQKYFNSPELI